MSGMVVVVKQGGDEGPRQTVGSALTGPSSTVPHLLLCPMIFVLVFSLCSKKCNFARTAGTLMGVWSKCRHAQIFADQEFSEIIPVRDRKYLVRDFTNGMPAPSLSWEVRRRVSAFLGRVGPLDIGRYNEVRGSMYDTLTESVPVVDDGAAAWGGVRNIHIGVDIGAAVGTPVLGLRCMGIDHVAPLTQARADAHL